MPFKVVTNEQYPVYKIATVGRLMKKIFLILILPIITVAVCKAQITHTGTFVKIDLPNGVYKLTKQQVDALPGVESSINAVKVYPPYLYRLDDLLLGLNNVNQDSINNNLPGVKKFIDQLYTSSERRPNKSYQSIIKTTYHNNRVLIVKYDIKSKGHIRFYCQNASKTLTLSGKIEYSKPDSSKAEALLNDILKNIQFAK